MDFLLLLVLGGFFLRERFYRGILVCQRNTAAGKVHILIVGLDKQCLTLYLRASAALFLPSVVL